MNYPKKRPKTPKTIILESIAAGSSGGVARVLWEQMSPSDISGITPNYFTYGFMAGFVALACVLTFELNFASWTKRVGVSLLAGFFFQSLIASGHLEAQLIQQQNREKDYVASVSEVSLKSNSPASHSEAIDALEEVALDKLQTENIQDTAIDGLAKVTNASNNYDVKSKAISSLVKIGVNSDRALEKQEIIQKLRQMENPSPSRLNGTIAEGIEQIQRSLDNM